MSTTTMSTTTVKLTFEEFLQLPQDGKSYELNQGELLVTPSPTPYHNIVRYRLRRFLADFVETHGLGAVIDETDFRLAPNTVRKPDIALIATQQLKSMAIHKSPVDGAPALAVEVVSPSNSALDMIQKVHQYLDAGCQSVWVVYPPMNLISIHDSEGIREAIGTLREERLFAGLKFTLSLAAIFNEDLAKSQ